MEMKRICLKRVIGILLPPRPGWDRDHKSGGIRNQKSGASRRGGRVVLHPHFCFRFFSSAHFCVFSVHSNVTNWTILKVNWPLRQSWTFVVKSNFQSAAKKHNWEPIRWIPAVKDSLLFYAGLTKQHVKHHMFLRKDPCACLHALSNMKECVILKSNKSSGCWSDINVTAVCLPVINQWTNADVTTCAFNWFKQQTSPIHYTLYFF